jgi:hypothetical protein
MKNILMACAAMVALTGCGAAARTPEMYREDTKSVLTSKNAEILACYDGVLKSAPGAQGRVTLRFDIETEAGMLTNVSVDAANTTAPPPVADCVLKSLGGLSLNPVDGNKGEATWSYEFVAPMPAAALPAAPAAAIPAG